MSSSGAQSHGGCLAKGCVLYHPLANLDMIQHYRPRENVVQRPTIPGGRGFQITGHHEILFPLLYTMVRDRLS